MQLFLKQATIAVTIIALLMVPSYAMAAEYENRTKIFSSGEMIADGVLVRPLGIVSLVAGFGLFIISSPFSGLGGNIGDAWETLVVEPAKFTFARPLGKF